MMSPRPILVVFLLAILAACSDSSSLPDLDRATEPQLKKIDPQTNQTDVKIRKKTFFEQLRPVIDAENERVLMIRKAIIALQEESGKRDLTESELEWLEDVGGRYRIEAGSHGHPPFADLLRRVDVVPASLAMSQAAMESAWGRSRFAQQGNNLFGQWCFSKGCGIVPAQRNAGATHEVAQFKTVNAAVRSYFENLNRHPTYSELRQVRNKIRNGKLETKTPGVEMAVGLENYSELGTEYVDHITTVIRQNKLSTMNKHLVSGAKVEH